jgi:hypothetical protein
MNGEPANMIDRLFSGPAKLVFSPINNALTAIDSGILAIAVTMVFFATALFGVFFVLKKEYVNLDRPRDTVIMDLRLWAVIAMLPYILIYLFFGVDLANW